MSEITVRGARLHNLKNISFSLPKNKFVVFTGLSGSGKSTMAFDTLHKEGQHQYMESLGMVTYESRPPARLERPALFIQRPWRALRPL
jgi:excinuclease ABC subunit A